MSLTDGLVTRSGRLASQQPAELASLIGLFRERGVRSYLEIGARHGDTFFDVMTSLPAGSVGVAVDMPNGPWGGNSKNAMLECLCELSDLGYNVSAMFGDSSSLVPEVLARGPFDAVLIDGDHRYDGVKSDWHNYGDAPLVAFHDIDGEGLECGGLPVEVPRLWREIKAEHDTIEFIQPSDDRRMGIGVVIR